MVCHLSVALSPSFNRGKGPTLAWSLLPTPKGVFFVAVPLLLYKYFFLPQLRPNRGLQRVHGCCRSLKPVSLLKRPKTNKKASAGRGFKFICLFIWQGGICATSDRQGKMRGSWFSASTEKALGLKLIPSGLAASISPLSHVTTQRLGLFESCNVSLACWDNLFVQCVKMKMCLCLSSPA